MAGRNRLRRPSPVGTTPERAGAGPGRMEEPRLAHSHVIWRLGDVHFLSAAEKRRLALERPYVWSAYRARLFPLP